MVNSLQVLIHLAGCGFNIPANAGTMFGVVVNIVNINVIPEEYLAYLYFWNYGTDDSPVDDVPGEARNL